MWWLWWRFCHKKDGHFSHLGLYACNELPSRRSSRTQQQETFDERNCLGAHGRETRHVVAEALENAAWMHHILVKTAFLHLWGGLRLSSGASLGTTLADLQLNHHEWSAGEHCSASVDAVSGSNNFLHGHAKLSGQNPG